MSQAPPPAPPPAVPPPPPPPPAAAPPAPAFDIGRITSRLNQAELLLVGGALIILLISELLLGILLAEYGVGQLPLLLSAGIVALVWLQKTARAHIASYSALLVVLGAALGFLGLVQILNDLRGAVSFSSDALTWLGRLSFYAGTLLAGFGAYVLARASRLLGT